MTGDAGTAQLDDELEAAARAVLDAHEALLRARGRRDRALCRVGSSRPRRRCMRGRR
jgi:hypothetical protein